MSETRAWLDALGERRQADEFQVKELLRRCGIAVPRGVRLMPGDALPALDFPAPYVVKVCSPTVLHKTDTGGVVLRLPAAELAGAVDEMRRRFPDTPVLVEEQLKFQGTEMIVGALMDPELGPAVMVGAGGILTELYRDVTFRLAPCPVDEARRMLTELHVAPVFEGFRGSTLDAGGLAEIIARVGDLALELRDCFSQLDLNPLVSVGGTWTALDAKIVLGPAES